MAKHDFGIMQTAPKAGERYDDYEPEKYNCISVDDDFIEQIAEKTTHIPCFWHTVDNLQKGLAYCGVTLIPPESLPGFINALYSDDNFAELAWLMNCAHKENRFVIHYGL